MQIFKFIPIYTYLIRELKKRYPYKIFAAYTGSTYDISLNSYLEGVHIIKKDIEIDDWCTEIDLLIRDSHLIPSI